MLSLLKITKFLMERQKCKILSPKESTNYCINCTLHSTIIQKILFSSIDRMIRALFFAHKIFLIDFLKIKI